MNAIYHILGADIPHHNRQVLAFFQAELLPKLANQNHHFYVVGEERLKEDFPSLAVATFSSKKAIAQAVVVAHRDLKAQFVLHGQFNFWLWAAIWTGKLPACRCYWHIWGADLYEEARGWKARLAYAFRRQVQRKLPIFWGTQGDLQFARQHLGREGERDRQLYFPTKMSAVVDREADRVENRADQRLTILLGNSGDHSNRHLEALARLRQQFGEQVRIIIPMGYPANNHAYIEEVWTQAVKIFPQNAVEILTQKLTFEQYEKVLAECDLGYFNFKRQQGIGTICLLLARNIPVVLAPENPFILDMKASGVPFLSGEFSLAQVAEVRQALQLFDKRQIAFFYPNYVGQWLTLLAEISEV